MRFEITKHARKEMDRRAIPEDTVEAILQKPDQIAEEYGGRRAYQSIMDFGTGKSYLVRVIVDDTVVPGKVVTVHKTSKIDKYWRHS
jgi:hypothetical protein